jgi:RYK receptor-like tyrosine kinase
MALSRDFFPNDYHCLGDNENRPIKWMAMESLTRREFSAASDIVSSILFKNYLKEI